MRASVTVAHQAHNLEGLGSTPKPASNRIEKITNRPKTHGMSTRNNHRAYTKAKNIIRHNFGMKVSEVPREIFLIVMKYAETYLNLQENYSGHQKDKFRNIIEGFERNRQSAG
jgi:hypothetical protein